MASVALHNAEADVLTAEAAERSARSAIATACMSLSIDATLGLPEPVREALAEYYKANTRAREARSCLAQAKAGTVTRF